MAQPPISTSARANIAQFIVVLLCIWAIVMAVLMTGHRIIADADPETTLQYAYGFLSLLSAVIVCLLIRRKAKASAQWTLSARELVGGGDRRVRITLADISQISIGMPTQSLATRFYPWLKNAVVIKLKQKKIMTLTLFHCENDDKLMQALIDRCGDKFDGSPVFSSEELAILRRLKWNRLINLATGKAE